MALRQLLTPVSMRSIRSRREEGRGEGRGGEGVLQHPNWTIAASRAAGCLSADLQRRTTHAAPLISAIQQRQGPLPAIARNLPRSGGMRSANGVAPMMWHRWCGAKQQPHTAGLHPNPQDGAHAMDTRCRTSNRRRRIVAAGDNTISKRYLLAPSDWRQSSGVTP